MRDISGVKIKRLLLSFLATIALAASAHADSEWMTDFDQAQQKAKSDHKLLLLNFTGSDWCGWCIKLNREVFSKPEFQEYANKNLVLVELDFPRAKQIDRALLRKNMELAEKFQIEGFPTIIVMNDDGKVIGALSYDSGVPPDSNKPVATPAAFIASVEKLRKS